MAETWDDLILRVRTVGFSEAEAQSAALRDEVRALGDTTVAAGTRARTGFGMFSRGLGGLGAAIGITGAIVGIKDLVHAGMDLQKQQNALRAVLQNMGATGEAAYKRMDSAAIGMAEHGGFIRPEMLTVLTRFLGETHNQNESLLALRATVALARGTTIGWQAAQMAVGRALAGNTTRLAQYVGYLPQAKNAEAALTAEHQRQLVALRAQYALYGPAGRQAEQYAIIQLRQRWANEQNAKVTDKNISLQQVLGRVMDRYGSSVDKFNRSTAGLANNLKNSFQIMIGEVGKSLLGPVNVVLTVFGALFKFIDKNRWLLIAIAGVSGFLGVGIAIKLLVSGLKMLFGAARDGFSSLFGLRTLLQGNAQAAAEDANFTRILGEQLAALDGVSAPVKRALAGMTEEEIANAAATARANQAIAAQIELAAGQVSALEKVQIAQRGTQIGQAEMATTVETTTPVMEGEFAGLALSMGPVVAAITAITVGLPLIIQYHKQIGQFLGGGSRWPHRQLHRILGKTNAGHPYGYHGMAAGHVQMTHLAGGGMVRPRYFDAGGLSVGSDTVPAMLTPGEYVLNSALTQQIGVPTLNSWSQGGYGAGQNVVIQPGPVVLNLDGRTLARGVVRYTVERAARGPSSLSGGSMVTGIGGPSGLHD